MIEIAAKTQFLFADLTLLDWSRMRMQESIPKVAAALRDMDGRERRGYDMDGATAVIAIDGPLQRRGDIWSMWLGLPTYEGIALALDQAEADPEVKDIRLSVDSPGGEAMGVHALARRIAAVGKPIEARADGIMASAAYYLSAGADRITSASDALVGSIGSVITHVEMSRALDRQGVTVTRVGNPANKAGVNRYEPLGEDGKAQLQAIVDDATARFQSFVSQRRKIPTTTLTDDIRASVFTASAALKNGLVDEIL